MFLCPIPTYICLITKSYLLLPLLCTQVDFNNTSLHFHQNFAWNQRSHSYRIVFIFTSEPSQISQLWHQYAILPPPTIATPHSTSVLGIVAVVFPGCVVMAPVLGIFSVVAGSVVSDAPSLLLCSVVLAVDFARAEASEAAIEKRKQKLNMIDW